ncbi:MAG: TIGR03557 family F420-dependent LLM class oxidoreductase [Chloroflexi bacterium]|nr:TIGR03557 family F420-dependent LLM class oxidoreductase [Chloroflexota bacterium]
MGTLGYAAMFEQFTPSDLLRFCEQAEDQGFTSVMASDHFHPWTPQQGQSGFVWAWMGALGERTKQRFGTGVTPPGYRYHPAIIAQASATLEAMYPGRFYLGLGAGEALNEHIIGEYWPEPPVRLERLMESIEVIQKLFTGKVTKYSGKHIKLESARLYTLPENPPPIYVATSGPIMSERTGKLCDGIITVGAADEKIKTLMGRFEKGAREAGKEPATMPRMIQLHVSWAPTQAEAEENAVKEWPNGGMPFPKGDIRNPEDFEAMAKFVRIENFKNRVLTSPDLGEHTAHIQHFIDLGFNEVYVHNVGRNQEEFIAAYGREVAPNLRWDAAG